jgi:hypothetical protein
MFCCLIFLYGSPTFSQDPQGKWKMVSHLSTFEGDSFDSYKALLTQRPCAAKIVWEINADQTFRLNASASGCDERYRSIQERLYSKTNWRMKGNLITISTQKDFSVGQSYIVLITGKTMTWTGTNGQGTLTYVKL